MYTPIAWCIVSATPIYEAGLRHSLLWASWRPLKSIVSSVIRGTPKPGYDYYQFLFLYGGKGLAKIDVLQLDSPMTIVLPWVTTAWSVKPIDIALKTMRILIKSRTLAETSRAAGFHCLTLVGLVFQPVLLLIYCTVGSSVFKPIIPWPVASPCCIPMLLPNFLFFQQLVIAPSSGTH